MTSVTLACGRGLLEAPEALLTASAPRVDWYPFVRAKLDSRFVVTALEGPGAALKGPLGEAAYQYQPGRLAVGALKGAGAAELVLRVAYHLAIREQGGALIHAAGVAGQEHGPALVASGVSGAGKSTLARLAAQAGLDVLSDEILALFPDGTVTGTPFRSDLDNRANAVPRRARYFAALAKGSHEALEALSVMDASALALSQRFEVPELLVPDARPRLLAFLDAVELRRLTFRKDSEAGKFVAAALSAAKK